MFVHSITVYGQQQRFLPSCLRYLCSYDTHREKKSLFALFGTQLPGSPTKWEFNNILKIYNVGKEKEPNPNPSPCSNILVSPPPIKIRLRLKIFSSYFTGSFVILFTNHAPPQSVLEYTCQRYHPLAHGRHAALFLFHLVRNKSLVYEQYSKSQNRIIPWLILLDFDAP